MHNKTCINISWWVIPIVSFNPIVQVKYENRWWNVSLLEVVVPRKPCFMQRTKTTLHKFCSICRDLSFFFFKISKVFVKMPVDGRNLNRVKPKKITVRNKRALLWTLQYLKNARKPFTVKTLRMQADLLHLSTCAINCCLNKHNYKYLQLRKKGLLTSIKNRKRLLFPRSVKKLREIFWKDGVSFYLDRVGFAHRTNPQNESQTSRTKAWRKPNKGLQYTTKSKKESSGGRIAHFFVSIAFNKSIVNNTMKKLHLNSFQNLSKKMFSKLLTKLSILTVYYFYKMVTLDKLFELPKFTKIKRGWMPSVCNTTALARFKSSRKHIPLNT